MRKSTLVLSGILSMLAGLQGVLAQSPAFHHPPGKYILVNGARLWIEEEGHGTPLFLIAGGPGNAHTYMHAFDPLKDTALLVFIDAFGRGKSDTAKNVNEYSIARDVSDIEGIRKALGFDKINVLGHSYGSVVAQLYACRYGSHIKHLVIADGFYSGKMWQENDDNANHEIAEGYPVRWQKIMALRAKGLRSSDSAIYTLEYSIPYGFLYAYNPDHFLHPIDTAYPHLFNRRLYYQLVGPDGDFTVGNDIARFDVTTQLRSLKMPVLILAGRFDRVSVPSMAVRYKHYLPQAEFVMFEHSGHEPMTEEPGKTFSVIRAFLKR